MSSQTFDAETVDAIFSERDQLKVENAKLKEERDRMYKANVEKNGEILRLLKDNAKLRELCADMWEYVKIYADTLDAEVHGYTWPYNTHGYGDKVRNGLGAFGGFPNRMRELGIEVEG